MLSATPLNILNLSPNLLPSRNIDNALFTNIWKRSVKSSKKSDAHLLLTSTSVQELAKNQELLFVKEGDTVQHILSQFTAYKTSFAVVMDNLHGRPIGTFDIERLFAYCTDKITNQKIPFETLLEKLEELKRELAKASLGEIVPYSNQSKQTWQYRTIPASRSVMHLIHILCANPGLNKVPILDEKGIVQAVVDISDVLRFILENDEEFSDLTKSPIAELLFTRKSLPAMNASRDQLMSLEFKVMWQKHINGLLGCCNRSSSLDLFFNYVHHVLSGFQRFPGENEPTGQIEVTRSVEELLDLVLRENLDSVYITDKHPKRIVGVITITQLLASFCQ